MLLVNQLIGFGVGGEDNSLALTYVTTQAYSAAAHTSRTFSGVDIGAADARRYVVVVAQNGDNTDTMSSVTVGGAATTRLVTNTSGGNAIFITNAPVTSGTTADIAVTNSGSVSASVIHVYTLVGNVDLTPVDTIVDNSVPAGSAPLGPNDIDVVAGGVVIGGSTADSSSPTCTWTNLTEDYDAGTGSDSYSAARASIAASGVLSVTADWSTDDKNLVVVSLKPVGA